MKTYLTILILFSASIIFAQPSQSKPNNTIVKNGSETEKKKELVFTKRKSAFDDAVKTAKEPEVDVNKIWDKPDVEAQYITGKAEFIKLVQTNLNTYVPISNDAAIGSYTVKLNVIFNKDATVKTITPITNLGFGMEKEAIRVFNLSKNSWKPATVKNKQVNSLKTFTFTFLIKE